MRYIALLIGFYVVWCAGCTTHRFLDRNVIRQTSTLTDLMYQQVLDNVAMFANRRAALPHLAVIGDGTAQAQDGGTGGGTLGWNNKGFNSASLPLSASRQLMENWKLQPVMTAGRLMRLRCGFQFVFESPVIAVHQAPGASSTDPAYLQVPEGCIKCVQEFIDVGLLPAPPPTGTGVSPDNGLNELTKNEWRFDSLEEALGYRDTLAKAIECTFPTNWFVVGTKKSAPRHGCLVGIDCDTYVWVRPGGEDALARFTATVLALATLDPPSKLIEKTVTKPKSDAALRRATAELLATLAANSDTLNKAALDAQQNRAFRVQVEINQQLEMKKSELSNELQEAGKLSQAAINNAMMLAFLSRGKAFSLSKELEPGVLMQINDKAVHVMQEIEKYMAPPETTTMLVPEVQDAFSRPGSSPLSRGPAGLEFTPSMPTP